MLKTNNKQGRSLEQLLENQKPLNNRQGNDRQGNDRRGNDRQGNDMQRNNRQGNNRRRNNRQYSNIKNNIIIPPIEDITDITKFPKLSNNDINSDNSCNLIVNKLSENYYKNVIIANNANNRSLMIDNVFPGWTMIDKKTKKFTTYDLRGKIINSDQKKIPYNKNNRETNIKIHEINEINKIYKKLSNNWCRYYDDINMLLGDRSIYLNYKNEINELVIEDKKLFTTLYELIDDNSSSDDEYSILDD